MRSRHALRSCASRIQVAASVLMPADLSALLCFHLNLLLFYSISCAAANLLMPYNTKYIITNNHTRRCI
jgi:hypothetical protein